MKLYRQIPLMMALGLCAAHAYAADGTITFTGSISAQTCKVSITAPTVNLPSVQASALARKGDTAGQTGFNIKLTGCAHDTSDAKSVAVAFTGGNVDHNTTYLVNTGDAKNVEVALLNGDDDSAINPDDLSTSHPVKIGDDGNATLNYRAQYVATNDTATAGKVNTSADFTLTYQ